VPRADPTPGALVRSYRTEKNWSRDRLPARCTNRSGSPRSSAATGQSSHHPRPVELYQGKPILYGCGDLINDYEGIGGHDSFRGDLSLLYLTRTDSVSGELLSLQMIPPQVRRMRLERASQTDAEWLRATLERTSRQFGLHVAARSDDLLEVASLDSDTHPRMTPAGVGG
jgi:hypothetical protein